MAFLRARIGVIPPPPPIFKKKGAWVNNCVGHGNQKAYVLLLVYTTLLCFLVNLAAAWDVASFSGVVRAVL